MRLVRGIQNLANGNVIGRGLQHKIVGSLKAAMSCPDPFRDISDLIRRTSPDALLDIGSHVGWTIERFLESNRIPIHGFEPTSQTFDQLSRRFGRHPMVTLHNIALSDKTGEAVFHCNSGEQTNSLLDNDTGNEGAFPDLTRHVTQETVRVMRMDDWMAEHLPLEKVVVKSDVQGAEGLLMAGGMKTFRNQVIGFYSEAQIAPMYKGQMDFFSLHRLLVDDLGFVLHNIYPCLRDGSGRAVQTDALWIKGGYLDDHSAGNQD